ncbi:MAG: hypothetical protein Q8R02_03870 [Hyphomonadaceae bacterium]|nr:hypothetical protein [Hyphomonadaceae bacterium]
MSRAPPPNAQEFVTVSHSFRGAIVNAYAQVEFMLADLVARCRQLPDYASEISKLPYGVEARAKAIKKLCAMAGPLNQFQNDLVPIADKLLALEEDRHFLTHGFAICEHDKQGNVRLVFRRFVPRSGDEWTPAHRNFTPDELKHLQQTTTVFVSTALETFRRVHVELGFA